MKITMYELIGLVKDGKAPRKIEFNGLIWEYTGYQYQRTDKSDLGNIWNGYNFNVLNCEVEIIVEKVFFERQVNQDLYYTILEKGFGRNVDIEHIDFENDIFKISPYDWNEPENPQPNFIHKPSGFKLWWYKYPLRSPEVNFDITHEEFSCILYDCVNSISKSVKWEIDKFWENKEVCNND